MSRKKYRSIACAIALATSFAGTQGLVYAAATEVPAADSSVTTDAAAMAAQSTGAAPAAQPAAESTGTPDASPAPAEAAPSSLAADLLGPRTTPEPNLEAPVAVEPDSTQILQAVQFQAEDGPTGTARRAD